MDKVKTQIKELAQNFEAKKSEIEILKNHHWDFNPGLQNSKVNALTEGVTSRRKMWSKDLSKLHINKGLQ